MQAYREFKPMTGRACDRLGRQVDVEVYGAQGLAFGLNSAA